VWEVRDRYTQEHYALKVLSEDATEHEMAALVREAVALSGLEGLGVPRVARFGRLPDTGRPFMVRELVPGKSLDELMHSATPTRRILAALASAADQLTLVHRAGFFHGDVKPANIIVNDRGEAMLVDLGLAAPWRDAGITAPGLTPKYAAPELLGGRPLTVRAEVYALGVALREAVERGERSVSAALIPALLKIAQRATAVEPETRHPSADEFAVALRRVAGIEQPEEEQVDATAMWPIVGIDTTASRLVQSVCALAPGEALCIRGRAGSGRSVLLRRLAWSLGVEGDQLVWVDDFTKDNAEAIGAEVRASGRLDTLFILVDDADRLEPAARAVISDARSKGARIVSVGSEAFGSNAHSFEVPPMGEHSALELLKRAIPSLTDRMAKRMHASAMGLPGELKRFVSMLAQKPVVSDEDVDQLLFGAEAVSNSIPASDPLTHALALLGRGRYDEAKNALELVQDADPLVLAVTRARLSVGLGDGRKALAELQACKEQALEREGTREAMAWKVWLGRAHISLAEYSVALELLATTREAEGSLGAESLAFEGLALSHLDDQEGAERCLQRAVQVARDVGDARVTGLAWACLGLVLQRGDEVARAEAAYREALTCAQNAGDASTLGTVQGNLAVLLKVRGDIAGAIEHFEAAVDMGKRSGRRVTVRHALIQLANADIYLGRLGRARASIEALEAQRDELPAPARGQLSGLQAELMARVGETQLAVRHYQECALAYEKLGSAVDGAEARLEGVLVAVTGDDPDIAQLNEEVARAKAQLGETTAHRALVLLAAAKVALASGDDPSARDLLDQGVAAAREADQRDWIWRLLAARADHEERNGQTLMARRDRTEAVTVLEEIAARLPRDLREVFWNDPRRRELRAKVDDAMAHAATRHALGAFSSETPSRSVISSIISTPLEQRLARLLEINRDLLGELDLGKLTAKIVCYAVELVQAERGFVILRDADGGLAVHSSSTRPGDIEHQQFSRSIAERVMDTREPIVSMQARSDARMQGYTSVHQMLLESVASVPIMGRYGEPIGALYVETRRSPGKGFEREIPTLRAFADQVALAIDTARLVTENRQRADELSDVNERLVKAQERLRESLGDRTEQLKRTRQKLRHAQDTLYGHFGYQGVVGSSNAMRRCYALIDRVKDTDVPVLITGESGTGKEVAARAIHRASTRNKAPFLGVNCGAIPENLLESELFGHVRGAFTGADRDRKGLLRDATGGTVLLDEIGEMPQKMQAGLLRVLQERTVRPVGGTREEPVDCRFLFATHRNLREMVDAGRFREDLFYRIHVVELPMPALRERTDDLPLLVDHFLGIFAARYKRDRGGLTKDALRRLGRYNWPGNVRQLEHVLLSAWIMNEEGEIDAGDLELPDESRPGSHLNAAPQSVREPSSEYPKSSSSAPNHERPVSSKGTLSDHRRSEKERIIEALEASNWNRVKAAELSGIPRRTFYRRLREYNIQ
jgi:serine/threonine-protein kinase PknK